MKRKCFIVLLVVYVENVLMFSESEECFNCITNKFKWHFEIQATGDVDKISRIFIQDDGKNV